MRNNIIIKISSVVLFIIISFVSALPFLNWSAALASDTVSPRSMTITRIARFRCQLTRAYMKHKLPKSLKELPLDQDETTKDGWNRDLGYHFDGKDVVTIWSLGQDGLPGGENEDMDIVEMFQFYKGMEGNNEFGKTLRHEGQVLRPDWGKLDSLSLHDLERQVRRIDIELYNNVFSKINMSVTDKSQLQFITNSLTSPLRIASKYYNTTWNDNLIGKITVVTDQDSFIIGINPSGFSLESKTSDVQNVFFSYSLAQFINEIYHKETKKYIELSIIEGLSGENRLKSDKLLWDKWKAKDGLGGRSSGLKTLSEGK
jgi:hypothetical protein